jgi:hypothetical protein
VRARCPLADENKSVARSVALMERNIPTVHRELNVVRSDGIGLKMRAPRTPTPIDRRAVGDDSGGHFIFRPRHRRLRRCKTN